MFDSQFKIPSCCDVVSLMEKAVSSAYNNFYRILLSDLLDGCFVAILLQFSVIPREL